MRYGKLPKEVLNIVLHEAYEESKGLDGFYEVTLKKTLEEVNQDIICSDYEVSKDGKKLLKFTAWTKYTVFQLVTDGIDNMVIAIPRHPYSFLYKGR